MEDPELDLTAEGEQALGYSIPVKLGDVLLVLLIAMKGTIAKEGRVTKLKATTITAKECRLIGPSQYEEVTESFEQKHSLYQLIKEPLPRDSPALVAAA